MLGIEKQCSQFSFSCTGHHNVHDWQRMSMGPLSGDGLSELLGGWLGLELRKW